MKLALFLIFSTIGFTLLDSSRDKKPKRKSPKKHKVEGYERDGQYISGYERGD